MKSKITRILGVVLALFMVASTLLLPAKTTPVAAEPGNTEWYMLETLPGYSAQTSLLKKGASVRDFAIASDGKTIWAIDEKGTQTQRVYYSTNAGEIFLEVPGYPGAAPVAVAVAPDDNGVVAVADAANVHTSLDWGITWSTLPARPANTASSRITDVAVGSARAETLFGREFFISLADPLAGATNTATQMGDVMMIGLRAAWESCGALNPVPIQGTMDYTSVVISPNFVSDRVVIALGSSAAGPTVQIINTYMQTVIRTTPLTTAATTKDYDSTFAVAGSIRFSSVAVPSNFDPATQVGRTVYISIGSVLPYTDNDVYRIDDNVTRKLEAVSNLPVASIAYNGTIQEGVLFMGRAGTASGGGTDIKWTTNPISSLPTWILSYKMPTGVETNPALGTFVGLARDFSKTKKVFATTTAAAAGDNNGFFISKNAGLSFEAEGFINMKKGNTVGEIQDIRLSDDGKMFYMATFESPYLSVWTCGTPLTGLRWSRIYSVYSPASVGVILRLSPDPKQPAIYLVDKAVGGSVYVSTDGGSTWSTRTIPVGIQPGAFAVRDINTIYLAEGNSAQQRFYKSTNGGWTWSLPVSYKAPIRGVSPSAGFARSMILPLKDHIVIGCDQSATLSRDDGATWSGLVLGLETSGNMKLAFDDNYAKTGFVFAGGDTDPRIRRREMEMDPAKPHLVKEWDTVGEVPAGFNADLYFSKGTLYVLSTAGGLYRSNNSTEALGTIEWSMLDAKIPQVTKPVPADPNTWDGDVVQMKLVAVAPAKPAGSVIYTHCLMTTYIPGKAPSTALRLPTYLDWLSATKPEITTSDKYSVPIDPVTGRGDNVQINIKRLGTGTGTMNRIEVEINLKATGLISFLPGTGGGFPFYSRAEGQAVNPVTLTYDGILISQSAPSFTYGAVGSGATIQGPWTSNTEYIYRVRVADTVSGEKAVSLWSAPRTLIVGAGGVVQQPYAGPVLLGPAGGAQNIDPKLVGFSWASVAGATEYEVKVATDAALTKTIGGTPAKVTIPSYSVANLEFATTYFWSVLATKPNPSPVSVGTFTTAAKPVPVPTVAPYTPPPPVTPIIQLPPPETPPYIWAVIVIGAILVLAVIVLIVRTRRVP